MIKNLLQDWAALKDNPKAALCSVIQWKGSVPRKDYPMMLVLDDGSILGTIGGGSMELKVTQSALAILQKNAVELFDFDMTGDDVDAEIGLCGGSLKVLVEPFTQALQKFYQDMLGLADDNQNLMVKLEFNRDTPLQVDRQFLDGKKSINESDKHLQARLQNIFENQRTGFFEHKDTCYLVWQTFTPPTIHLFGAGHVGQATAELAHFNDLDVIVYDDRAELMTPERFPCARQVKIGFPLIREDVFIIPENDFVLIASREHKHDRELLSKLLQTPPRYIGLVSSARKWQLLSQSLLEAGVPEETLAQVHAPVGIDIQAQTVSEIAVSIISEIIKTYRKPQ